MDTEVAPTIVVDLRQEQVDRPIVVKVAHAVPTETAFDPSTRHDNSPDYPGAILADSLQGMYFSG